MIYGTGFGILDPPAADGQSATSAASTATPVTATISGIPAQVVYAGAAPGLVAGVAQVNVIVPKGLPTNPSTPILLTAGSASTQTGVTIAIR
jgi:uncharacterized protein (TIGR03437 family)